MFDEQLSRIRNKLALAKSSDPENKRFGADWHEYDLNERLDRDAIKEFEEKHGVQLPQDFADFLINLGHGGAGPHYGIYQLGDFGYMIGCEKTMTFPCLVDSKLTKDDWDELIAFEEEMTDHDSIEYEQKYDSLFAGLLPIGTQGCNFQTMLILNGEFRGRILNIDQDLQMPIVAKEKNFLDWYEAWLDRILKP